MARTSGSMLLKLLQMEQELFEAYFNLSETCGKYLASMLDVFCSHFYYVWRPRIVEEQNLPKLVDIIEIFKSEILPEDKASENISIARNCSKKILQLAIADAQVIIPNTYLHPIPTHLSTIMDRKESPILPRSIYETKFKPILLHKKIGNVVVHLVLRIHKKTGKKKRQL